MPSTWYFTRDGKQRLGPFSFEQLRQLSAGGLLDPSHMVLEPGSGKWTPAGSISGLFPPAQQAPSPEPAPEEIKAAEPVVLGESDADRGTRSRTLWLALVIVGGGVLLLAAIALLASIDGPDLAGVGIMIFFLLLLGALVGGGIALGYVILGIGTACPECKRWRARILVGRKLIDKKKCYGLVTRRAYSHSSGSVSGTNHHWGQPDYRTFNGSTSSSGSTSWQERVPVIRTTLRLTYQCKFCGAKWNRTEVKQVEDFDIER